MATSEEIVVVVTAEDFTAALRDLVPSVSQAEMAKYAQIRERFSRSVNTASNADVDGGADDQRSNINTKEEGKGKGRMTTRAVRQDDNIGSKGGEIR